MQVERQGKRTDRLRNASGQLSSSTDALSRAPVEDDNFHFNFSEVNLLEFLVVSKQTRDRLVSATKEDKDLQKLIKLIKQGFRMRYKVLEPQLKHLYKFRDYLSTKDNLIFYKDKVFVPTSMRNDTKKKVHTSHLAVESNTRRALDTIFWPGMRHELQEYYINCEQCSRYSARNSKETLITRLVLEYPFQRIGLDTMTLDGREYLVCVNYFSNYTLVDRLHGTSSCCTIKLIKKHFMRYGIPEVVSDGGPEFDNKMMRELAHKYGLRWNPSSPEMPNSNGIAEAAVKQIKCIIKNVIMKTAILVWPY